MFRIEYHTVKSDYVLNSKSKLYFFTNLFKQPQGCIHNTYTYTYTSYTCKIFICLVIFHHGC